MLRHDKEYFFDKESDFSSIEAEGICLWMMFQATITFKSKYFITFYNYIYIYHTYKYVSYTYFTVYVEVFVCLEIIPLTSGVSLFVC